MLRRTLLQIAAALVVLRPIRSLARVFQTPAFSDSNVATLTAIADVVLPSDVGASERQRVVDRFVAWFANYREGADMGHGYGASTLREPSGPSPARAIPAQFAALDAAATRSRRRDVRGAAVDARRDIVEKLLNEPQPVNRLPAQPTGANLIADFMGFYFTSADAWDRLLPRARSAATAAARSTAPPVSRRATCGTLTRLTMRQLRSRRRHHRRRHHRRDGRREARPSFARTGPSSSSRPASGCSTSRTASSTGSAASTTARTSGPATSSPISRARGVISRTMAVGGSALHWGGVCNRFSEEDTRLKSLYGLAVDWPIEWKELERFYCEAERRLGVSGEPSPLPEDWRIRAVPDAGDADDLQPEAAQGVGRAERHPVLDDAAGEEHR